MKEVITTFEELVDRVIRQEEQVHQLIRIVAATNRRISELDCRQHQLENNKVY